MEEPGRIEGRESVRGEEDNGGKGEKAALESKGQWRTWRNHQKQKGEGDTALGSLTEERGAKQ